MDPDLPAEAATELPVADGTPQPVELEVEEVKQIYLRTVYPLNPGIPHFVDVPGGW